MPEQAASRAVVASTARSLGMVYLQRVAGEFRQSIPRFGRRTRAPGLAASRGAATAQRSAHIPELDHGHIGIPVPPRQAQLVQVVTPENILVQAQFQQVVPAEDAGVVAVVKADADGVVAGFFDGLDADIFLAPLQYLLAGAVTLDLG